MRAAAFGLSVATMLVITPRVDAQQTSSLGWSRLPGAESCISTQQLARRVERRLGRRAFVSASQSDLALEGRVERDAEAGAWVATLVISDARGRVLGRRVLRAKGDRCDVLDNSLTLVIAIAIDPGTSIAPAPGPGAISPEAEQMLEQLELPGLSEEQMLDELTVPQARPKPPAPRPEKKPQPPRPRHTPSPASPPGLQLMLGLAPVLTLGPLPAPGFGLATTVSLLPTDAFWLELGAEGVLPRERSVEAGTAAFSLLTGTLGLCPLASGSTLALRACAGTRVGVLRASGSGFGRNQGPAGLWAEARLYGRATWHLSSFFLEGGLELGLPLVRDRFRYRDRDGTARPLHRAAALTGQLGLGAGLHFR